MSEGSTELRSGDLDHETRLGAADDDADDDTDSSAAGGITGRGGTGSGGSKGVGDVLLIPESYVRLEPMDDERGREGGASTEGRGSGEDGRAWSLPTYTCGRDGGSGRRLGVRIRTLREGLGEAVCLDVLPDGVGEDARWGEVWVGDIGGGGGVVCLRGGDEGIDGSVDMPASASGTSSNSDRSPLSLFRCGTTAAPAGTASRTSKCVADETKFGDSCRISSIDPMSPLVLGACAFSFCPLSPSVCAGAEGAALSLSLSLPLSLSLDSLDVRCRGVGERARNVTLRLSRLSVNMGRYCDCGLKPEVAFRLVFSRMVSISCCMR